MAWADVIPAVLSAVGSAAKAGGQYKGGVATSQADMYKAAVAQNNAVSLGNAAERTVQGGIVNSDTAGMHTEENVGKALATQGALNIDPNSRTAANVRASIAESGRLNQMTTLNDAQLKGWGYRVQQQQQQEQIPLDEASATGAQQGGAEEGAGTLLAGASQLPWGKMFGSTTT